MSTNGKKELNQTDFAELVGVKRQAINKAIRMGKLRKFGKGRAAVIRLDDPLTVEYMKNSSPQREGISGKPRKSPRTQPTPVATKPKPSKTPPTKPTPQVIEKESPDNNAEVKEYLEKEGMKLLKQKEEVEKLQLHNKAKRNELIKRDLVQHFVNKMHEVDNGQWKTLGLKISTDVAAAFDIEDEDLIRKACAVIDKEVFNILKQTKRMMNSFLQNLGAEKIK